MTAPSVASQELVLQERHGAVAVLRFNDPERLNPMSEPLQRQLHEHLSALAGEAQGGSVRARILT
ncbi:MAG: hypothetical protein LBH31_04865, partial [Burkholderiaceae bacterium]|nr:hypothetical protein [Burkholderiaceae bacterium]